MWWTTSPWPTIQCTHTPYGVKHLAGHWPCPLCSVSLSLFSTNYCAAKDLCGRSVCAGAGMCVHLHSPVSVCTCWSVGMRLLGFCHPCISSLIIKEDSLQKTDSSVQKEHLIVGFFFSSVAVAAPKHPSLGQTPPGVPGPGEWGQTAAPCRNQGYTTFWECHLMSWAPPSKRATKSALTAANTYKNMHTRITTHYTGLGKET